MKTISKISMMLMFTFLFIASNGISQAASVVTIEKHPNKKVVAVKVKTGHIRKARIYHPYWAPRACFRHRWVYFPRYNFYWDNFRNVYVVKTTTVWTTSKTLPYGVEKVDLSKENAVELSEENDTQDSIQDYNVEHQERFKVK